MGALPPNPRDLTLLVSPKGKINRLRQHIVVTPVRPFLEPARRSGCFPALPYPPARKEPQNRLLFVEFVVMKGSRNPSGLTSYMVSVRIWRNESIESKL